MMTLALNPDMLLSTTRAVRRRLDLTRPVDRSVVLECLELALQAPSGSNQQSWHFVFVDDEATKNSMAAIYRRVFDEGDGRSYAENHPDEERRRVWRSALYLAEHFHEVPMMLVPCIQGRPGAGNQAGFWGSLLPAVWSFQLALRSRGMGSAWTTMHLRYEAEAAEVLGIPYEGFSQAGLFPIAYTIGTDFRPGPRRNVDEVVHWNSW